MQTKKYIKDKARKLATAVGIRFFYFCFSSHTKKPVLRLVIFFLSAIALVACIVFSALTNYGWWWLGQKIIAIVR